MPSQPTEASTSSPLHLLQSCLFASESSKDAARCLNDESPIHCLWDVVQSRIASNSALSVSRTTSSSSSYTVSRSELASAHDSLRQDFNLSSFIWNSDASSFRRWKIDMGVSIYATYGVTVLCTSDMSERAYVNSKEIVWFFYYC